MFFRSGYLFLLVFILCLLTSFAFAEAPVQPPANESKPDINLQLLKAASSGKLDELKQLIAQGADVNYHELSGGKTPLMYAAEKGHKEMSRS